MRTCGFPTTPLRTFTPCGESRIETATPTSGALATPVEPQVNLRGLGDEHPDNRHRPAPPDDLDGGLEGRLAAHGFDHHVCPASLRSFRHRHLRVSLLDVDGCRPHILDERQP